VLLDHAKRRIRRGALRVPKTHPSAPILYRLLLYIKGGSGPRNLWGSGCWSQVLESRGIEPVRQRQAAIDDNRGAGHVSRNPVR
jgi:hypothetical protein